MENPAMKLDGVFMKNRRGKSIVFIDLPQLINNPWKTDFYDLFQKLRAEFDDVKTFAKVPDENSGIGILRVAANAGALPILCPGDPDPIIAEEIRRAIERKDVGKIGVVEGDNCFFQTLETAKKRGVRIKVILPFNNKSRLLTTIADEVVPIESYTQVSFSDEHNISSSIISRCNEITSVDHYVR
jgi:uncharacterized LabA/DUF88 family protein